MNASHVPSQPPRGRYLALLSLGALGVVFGDISTSPLYALRECFFGDYAIALTPANVLGVLSLILWSLIIVISIKYLGFILRADNNGEGGIIALMSLVHPEHGSAQRGSVRHSRRRHWALVSMGLFGAALLYGDGMITPAISVLSAVEGLEIVTPVFQPYIIPITIVILIALFAFQRRGTGGVGAVFGPVMMVWLVTLAVLGIYNSIKAPAVFAAANPLHALDFLSRNEVEGFLVLGAVFLAVTGGEALYADMGHFGTRPIRLAWFGLVLPALLLNYFGQGALLLANPAAAHNPFYRLAPDWALLPLVALATMATIIASQAVISGAFSLSMQAIQLGYSPRLEIDHTSAEERGQIYMPKVNWVLMFATIGLVIGFESSSSLAAAYGVAVSTDMVITTLIFAVVAWEIWGWTPWLVTALAAGFLVVDLSFFGANIIKVPAGGWFPILVALSVFTLMSTWRRGRQILAKRLRKDALPLDEFRKMIEEHPPTRVPGTAVFMTGNPEGTPPTLLHNLKHNKVLHEQVALLTVTTEEVPHVRRDARVHVEKLSSGFFRVTARYGFMEDPHVPRALELAKEQGLEIRMMETTFFLGRERLIATKAKKGMAVWRERLFAFMSRNAQPATAFFHIPTGRVVELGAQVEL
ncbi:MAG TPA: potassium transporter Kup [Burkholderiaceae bacterium]|nr:potassium transporter Kup [Burkholderiaceae bacterium]